jgi:hypothetical protein
MADVRSPFKDGLFTENGFLQKTMIKPYCQVGADASGSATHITCTGVVPGDQVAAIFNVTDHAMATQFEKIVTVADQIQQATTDLSAKTLVILVFAQSAA